jgi:hypothetical protein
MKKTKLSMLALTIAASGMSTGYSANETFVPYTLSAMFTNSQAIWEVTRGPVSVAGFPEINAGVNVQTDGTGKITGGGTVGVVYNSGGLPFSKFLVKVTGKISSSKTKPTPEVRMLLAGPGYTADGNGGAMLNGSIVLAFTGAPGIDPNNTNRQTIVGTLEGKIAGQTPLGINAKFTLAATAVSDSFQPDFRRGRPDFDALDVVQSARRMVLLNGSLTGQGSVGSNNVFNATIKGVNASQGCRLALTGTLGPYTNNVGGLPVTFQAPVTLTLKGNVMGQIISGDATSVDASLIH